MPTVFPKAAIILLSMAFWMTISHAENLLPFGSDLTEQKRCFGNDDDVAIAACTNLLKRTGSDQSRVGYLYTRATSLVNKDDPALCDSAIADLEEAVRLWSPDMVFFLKKDMYQNLKISLGNIWNECKDDQDKAIAAFSEGIQHKPERAAALYQNRAQMWQLKHEYEKALDDLDKAFAIPITDEGKAGIWNDRARIYRDKGDYDRAISAYGEAIRLIPKDSIYFSNRGEAWRLKGNLENALLDQNRAVDLGKNIRGDGALAYYLRGDTFRYRGDFTRSIDDYQSALRNLPKYAPALTGLGLTYEKQGNLMLARKAFQDAIAAKRTDRSAALWKSAAETANARLAALDSGIAQPIILQPPLRAESSTSIQTPQNIAPVVERIPAGSAREKAKAQDRRVALVIGNSAYQNIAALVNPQKDAAAIGAALKYANFDSITIANNVTREQMINSLRNFANDAEKSDWAMVYYAGHGMEVGGVNYLVPVDAKIAVDRDIQFEAVPLSQVLNAADTAKKIKLVVLDACRDNPFNPRQTAAPAVVATSMSTAGAPITTRSSSGRGLAEVKVTGATLVVYAAKDGQVALDGDGANSPFAVAVVQRLATPGVEINKLFRLVRDDVMEATAGRQEPYTYGSLPGKEDFFFVTK